MLLPSLSRMPPASGAAQRAVGHVDVNGAALRVAVIIGIRLHRREGGVRRVHPAPPGDTPSGHHMGSPSSSTSAASVEASGSGSPFSPCNTTCVPSVVASRISGIVASSTGGISSGGGSGSVAASSSRGTSAPAVVSSGAVTASLGTDFSGGGASSVATSSGGGGSGSCVYAVIGMTAARQQHGRYKNCQRTHAPAVHSDASVLKGSMRARC